MPRPPRAVPDVAAMPGEPFSPGDGADGGPRYPLHVGDSWLPPFEGAHMQTLRTEDHPELHLYTATQGLPELVEAIVDKVKARNALPCERESVLVTGGATCALAAAVGMLASPGEEVAILAPFWPLIRGITRTFRARPVEVPFYDCVGSAQEAVAAVRRHLTPRTVALYVSTPSNPTGRVLPGDWLEALAGLARREDLWLLSDEVYEEYVYRGEHVSLGRFAPERTLSVFSFSKAYAMAGNRTGYLIGPPPAVAQVHKVSTHTVYSAPTAGQLAALQALRSGGGWLAQARASHRAAGAHAAAALGLPPPEGGTFLFVPLRGHLDERGTPGFLRDCLEDGVALAPGASSGDAYTDWARLCFTSVPPQDVAEAVRRIAARLGR